MALLAYQLDYWNAFMKESEHKHEKGESTEKCINCAAERLAQELTEFELFSIAWYRLNVSQFSFDAHLIGELIKDLKLTRETKILFLKNVDMIYLNDTKIAEARATRDGRISNGR